MLSASQLSHKTVNLLFIKQCVDGFVGKLTFQNHLIDTLCEMVILERMGARGGFRILNPGCGAHSRTYEEKERKWGI